MNKLLLSVSLLLLLPTQFVHADANRKECIGRLTFDVTEDMKWATFNAAYVDRITDGGGQGFSKKVGAPGDHANYGDNEGPVIYVSDIVERSMLSHAVDYRKGTSRRGQASSEKQVDTYSDMIASLKKSVAEGQDIPDEYIKSIEQDREVLRKKIPLTQTYEHDIGLNIPDAYFLGTKTSIYYVLLWRNNRVYFFDFRGNDKNRVQRIKDLIARFEPRDLYQVPEGPGFCFPYGFIHDDGKTKYSIKNSLRFTREPNVIFTILNASPGDPYMKATSGTYNTDYRPGYDRENWEKTEFVEPLYFDRRLAGMDGWRLDPKPGSAEKERAWFGLAKTGGLTTPLIAVQAKTFKQGTDDLTGLTPPPEVLMPSLKALTKSMKQTLGE
ncbi:T6SS immunity protein Tli4 family protein [Pseudomonas sp. EL_65y_Pfl2_R95]|uniref:T6SS immunity protein Tli4 family protein n=1 Tax=Pseudomonas sp. EL_65y_Pfl2_R95 TaxID=3088698 RepID=UPI0030DA3B62